MIKSRSGIGLKFRGMGYESDEGREDFLFNVVSSLWGSIINVPEK
jgi:hypothetical protein